MAKQLSDTQLKKRNEARERLIEKSREAKATREFLVGLADTEEEALKAAAMSINQILIKMYKEEAGCRVFRTFEGWKDEGYRVKKGETAFRIWGKPIKAERQTENNNGDAGEGGDVDKYKMFPMCCLFNEHQVEKVEAPQAS